MSIPCRYAFIEYEKEDDVMTAFKRSDGRKLGIVVDAVMIGCVK